MTNHSTKLVVRPEAGADMVDCGHSKFYKEILPQLDSYLDGRSRKITVASIERYIAKKLAAAQSQD